MIKCTCPLFPRRAPECNMVFAGRKRVSAGESWRSVVGEVIHVESRWRSKIFLRQRFGFAGRTRRLRVDFAGFQFAFAATGLGLFRRGRGNDRSGYAQQAAQIRNPWSKYP